MNPLKNSEPLKKKRKTLYYIVKDKETKTILLRQSTKPSKRVLLNLIGAGWNEPTVERLTE